MDHDTAAGTAERPVRRERGVVSAHAPWPRGPASRPASERGPRAQRSTCRLHGWGSVKTSAPLTHRAEEQDAGVQQPALQHAARKAGEAQHLHGAAQRRGSGPKPPRETSSPSVPPRPAPVNAGVRAAPRSSRGLAAPVPPPPPRALGAGVGFH